jgi:hypothetical protein
MVKAMSLRPIIRWVTYLHRLCYLLIKKCYTLILNPYSRIGDGAN